MICIRVVQCDGQVAKRQPAPLGRRSSSSATASDTVTASTVTWDRSSRNSGLGAVPTMKAAASCSGVTPGQQVRGQVAEALLEAGDAGQGAPGLVDQRGEGVGGGRVGLELEEAGQEAVALLEAGELLVVVDLVGPGEQLAAT